MTNAPSDELRVDFLAGPVGYRFRSGGGGHALVRATGLAKKPDARVVDATAGLGRDAFLLATQGYRITLIERSAEVHALLADGMARASATDPRAAAVIERMTLLHGDAKVLLPALSPDVIIVDPMHPPRGNSALVKKEMRLLRRLVGADTDVLDLMRVALSSAGDRVVLKWPRRASPLRDLPKPSYQSLGKTTRYDVFVTKMPIQPVTA